MFLHKNLSLWKQFSSNYLKNLQVGIYIGSFFNMCFVVKLEEIRYLVKLVSEGVIDEFDSKRYLLPFSLPFVGRIEVSSLRISGNGDRRPYQTKTINEVVDGSSEGEKNEEEELPEGCQEMTSTYVGRYHSNYSTEEEPKKRKVGDYVYKGEPLCKIVELGLPILVEPEVLKDNFSGKKMEVSGKIVKIFHQGEDIPIQYGDPLFLIDTTSEPPPKEPIKKPRRQHSSTYEK